LSQALTYVYPSLLLLLLLLLQADAVRCKKGGDELYRFCQQVCSCR
jgi:hypothetical protein